MLKKVISTYYYVFLYEHNHAKNESASREKHIIAFLQVFVALFCYAFSIFIILNTLLDNPINFISKPLFFLVSSLLGGLLYYVLFSVWHLKKEIDVEEKLKYGLTKTTMRICYFAFFLSVIGVLVVLFFFRK